MTLQCSLFQIFFGDSSHISKSTLFQVMEQRASALQQRLEARRNMFLKSDGNQTYGANRPQGKNATWITEWKWLEYFSCLCYQCSNNSFFLLFSRACLTFMFAYHLENLHFNCTIPFRTKVRWSNINSSVTLWSSFPFLWSLVMPYFSRTGLVGV